MNTTNTITLDDAELYLLQTAVAGAIDDTDPESAELKRVLSALASKLTSLVELSHETRQQLIFCQPTGPRLSHLLTNSEICNISCALSCKSLDTNLHAEIQRDYSRTLVRFNELMAI